MTTKAKKSAAEAAVEEVQDADGQTAVAPLADYAALADLGRENLAALLQANTVLSEGLEAIGEEVMSYTRASLENVARTAMALLAARTFEDVVQLNTEFAKASVERIIEGSTKLSEMGVRVAAEALGPLGSRVETTVQKLGNPPAA